jgi:hypothetical protein
MPFRESLARHKYAAKVSQQGYATLIMDAPGNLQTATPPTVVGRLLKAASQIEMASKVAIVCVFFGWFLVDTLVVTLGSLQHGVRFYDMSAVIADPSRMFFGLQGSLHRTLFIPLCMVCLLAPLLPHLRSVRVLWLSYIAPLVLMLICAVLLYSRTSGEFIATPSSAGRVGGNLIQFANNLVHHGGDLVARHVSIGVGGYLALVAGVVLALRGVRRFRSLRED